VQEKARILAESFEPGARVSEVARRNGVSRCQLSAWRRQAVANAAAGGDAPAPAFMSIGVQNSYDRLQVILACIINPLACGEL